MPRAEAEQELLAARADVWDFIAEPRHLADWWPGISAVEPDRRGLAPGARWRVRGSARPGLLRRSRAPGLLLVQRVDEPRLVAWQLTAERLDAELRLEETAVDRTLATLAVSGPWLVGVRGSLPRTALRRLHALCQTAAQL